MSVTCDGSSGRNNTKIYDGKTAFDLIPLGTDDYKRLMKKASESNHLVLCIALPEILDKVGENRVRGC